MTTTITDLTDLTDCPGAWFIKDFLKGKNSTTKNDLKILDYGLDRFGWKYKAICGKDGCLEVYARDFETKEVIPELYSKLIWSH
jgi:hypothetical protein